MLCAAAPVEGLGFVVIVVVNEAVDGGCEVADGAEDAVFQSSPGEFGEEALDGVQPCPPRQRQVKNFRKPL